MRIIPVLDLMEGRVVHGIRGERHRYQPVKSGLTPSAEPLAVALALQAETDCREMYIADLDALQGTGDHCSQISQLADQLRAELWVDMGITSAAGAHQCVACGTGRIILGSETLPDLAVLESIEAEIPDRRRVFSLDIVNGQVWSKASFLPLHSPLETIEFMAGRGWTSIILLTLDQVGTGTGPDWQLLETARSHFPRLSLFAGGGVHNQDDIERLSSLAIDGALVATALHQGWIQGHKMTAGNRPKSTGQPNE
jgi:phosphoribosylformimino-5-aminoimidazole carboxamide ribotide isomerase